MHTKEEEREREIGQKPQGGESNSSSRVLFDEVYCLLIRLCVCVCRCRYTGVCSFLVCGECVSQSAGDVSVLPGNPRVRRQVTRVYKYNAHAVCRYRYLGIGFWC